MAILLVHSLRSCGGVRNLAARAHLSPHGVPDARCGSFVKKLFYLGIGGLVLFELANVYFIMPMPLSQRLRTIDVAYFLHTTRWIIRAVCGAAIVAGASAALRQRGWRMLIAPAFLVVAGCTVYAANVRLSADRMFLEPPSLTMVPAARNTIEPTRLIVGIEREGEARAYPMRLIGYHHQVRDSIAGRPVLVTYCTVCRTGRVFSPVVNGSLETFRLVGMDHFNAMFEDTRTGSWWRQATGEAIVGPLKGKLLQEIPSRQMTLAQWLALHPKSLIMQADTAFREKYAKGFDFETGASRKRLTGTDTISWREKAWVIGVTLNGESKAYDWNRLKRERTVNDQVGGTPIVVALAPDRTNFFVFERPDTALRFTLRGDSLVSAGATYAITGIGPSGSLRTVAASQEFWHSWRTFHPGTGTY